MIATIIIIAACLLVVNTIIMIYDVKINNDVID